METIAVYWEDNIRTYGIQVEKNLCLVQADIEPSRLAELGRQLAQLDPEETRARLVLAHHFEPERLRIYMVFREKLKNQRDHFRSRPWAGDVLGSFVIESPVEMLYFHGPHFGDRYGIADMAGHALKKNHIRYIAVGCSAASVHFVFPENIGVRAQKALETVFRTP